VAGRWVPCTSSAVSAYRFDEALGVLELVFVEGRMVYDYPCDALLFDEFERAPSKGRFVNGVLKRHAEGRGWVPSPRPFV
jgi:hypothetical protein